MSYSDTSKLKVFIGYDSREDVAYKVLTQSLKSRATIPLEIQPLVLKDLANIYTRPRGPTESTEFSLTRFLVPYLSGFTGTSIFMDCDMLCLTDIVNLYTYPIEKENAVWVCKHDYTPKTESKFLGQIQTVYPRKNWSSMMVFNNALCLELTPEYINNASPLDLHRFAWTDNSLIGSLPLEWNWLVGEYPKIKSPNIVHYTLGGPWFKEYAHCDYSDEWQAEHAHLSQLLG